MVSWNCGGKGTVIGMTVIELYHVLHRYGVDVLFLAMGVTLLTSLLKKTVMKSANRKVFVFLPFGLGILIYVLYSLLARSGVCFTAEEIFTVVERGLSTGCAATLYYVLYEQFLRGKLTVDPLLPLLECVPEEKRQEASEHIRAACKDADGEIDGILAEQLKAYADPPLSEEELLLTAGLLKEYLSSIA